ncbi:hypothetical protein MMC12_002944 [Toensbergia leucococca]|nr:hypothetical protein [Toensbergia leucococca]
MFIAFRLLAGCTGSAPLTLGAGSIADLFVSEQRGGAMAVFALGPLLGPVIGPDSGGYLIQAKGWRWVFWVLSIVDAGLSILALCLLRETYHPLILERKAKKMREMSGNHSYRSIMASDLPAKQFLIRSMLRPLKMLFLSPIIFSLSFFMAIVYGYLYLMFTTFPEVFESIYHFSTGTVGLAYTGIGVGSLVGTVIVAVASDRILVGLTRRNGGEQKPEYRLPPLVFGAPFIPIGLFWYGWSARAGTHWILPIMGTAFVGLGSLFVFMPIQTYLVDAFTQYAASAIAANTVLRSVVGALLPLAGLSMFEHLGLGWGNSLLGFIAISLLPIPVVFYISGERIRNMNRGLKL